MTVYITKVVNGEVVPLTQQEIDNLNARDAAWVAPVQQVITDRQFFQQCAVQGLCTQDEAQAATSAGVIPQTILNLITQLPVGQQWPAKMAVAGDKTFTRGSPLVAILGNLFFNGVNVGAQTDALWAAAALL